jgi:DNA polymerase III subunit delta
MIEKHDFLLACPRGRPVIPSSFYNEAMDSLTFLERVAKAKPLPLYVVYGDEDFLRRQVRRALRTLIVGPDADDAAVSVYAGDSATYAAVFDDLATVPFFSPRRLVLVENADPFVTLYRANLEKAVANLPARGTLVLDVKTWPSNTRLAKLVDGAATIECKALKTAQLPGWCVQWAATQHGKQLSGQAASLLVDLVGQEMGLLDQELLKVAIYVGDRQQIEAGDVDRLVGNSRAENIWKILDTIGEGRTAEALIHLDRLLDQGEEPLRILGAFAMQLRRLAKAARLNQQGLPLPAALQQAGIQPWAVRGAEQQLKHLGRRRAERLYDWLLEVDFGLKGGSSLPERTLLERLVIRLARKS